MNRNKPLIVFIRNNIRCIARIKHILNNKEVRKK